MWRLIIVSFLGLGFAFYELSGGSDFQPPELENRVLAESSTDQEVIDPFVRADQNNSQFALLDKTEAPTQDFVDEANGEEVVGRALWDVPALGSDSLNLGAVQASLVSLDLAEAPVNVSATVEDVRAVSGNRVNLRNGPGTQYGVLSKLTRGEKVEILQEPGNGWLKLRVVETNRIGWLAASLVN